MPSVGVAGSGFTSFALPSVTTGLVAASVRKSITRISASGGDWRFTCVWIEYFARVSVLRVCSALCDTRPDTLTLIGPQPNFAWNSPPASVDDDDFSDCVISISKSIVPSSIAMIGWTIAASSGMRMVFCTTPFDTPLSSTSVSS
ncbi:hypothetical protein BamIOP4010DRAFT_2511 [Burkholderia ambifaria IOP40-10]|uniref:Uncharacterized protein n=2 Tax=Burkholderia ambifaria TaxID=152480 RepID=B1FEQ1_9BURK|nr:hypothetical protein BamIOP4010DRAFT_2511 [Burkholderia ambifaria IOP40-10]EDT39301.1 hypothetical protein BamMEX5DRAFT_4907 [Burkholderia ambifaria MEX-5]